MKILAIDPAEKTGWAVDKKIYGLWKFPKKKDETFGVKLIKFKKVLIEKIKEYNIELVVFEGVSGRFSGAIQSHSKFVAVIELVCLEMDIPYKGYKATEIKKFAGKGNYNKKQMIQSAIRKYHYTGKDDNEADALHLLHLAKTEML